MLRSLKVGGVWNGFLLGRVRGQPVPCRLCGAPDGDGHFFWECTCPPAVHLVEVSLGRYSAGLVTEWSPSDGFDADEVASLMPDDPNVWTDGSLVLDLRSQVYLPPVLGSLLVSQRIAGESVGGVMLIMSVQMVRFSLAGGFVLFLGLFSHFKRPRCGRCHFGFAVFLGC